MEEVAPFPSPACSRSKRQREDVARTEAEQLSKRPRQASVAKDPETLLSLTSRSSSIPKSDYKQRKRFGNSVSKTPPSAQPAPLAEPTMRAAPPASQVVDIFTPRGADDMR